MDAAALDEFIGLLNTAKLDEFEGGFLDKATEEEPMGPINSNFFQRERLEESNRGQRRVECANQHVQNSVLMSRIFKKFKH